jgi:hypothetical protein
METETDDDTITCWCGAKGKHEEMFAPMPSRCGGSGYMECDCGGDLCVCHNHGEMECFGCPDCEGDADDDFGYDDELR